MKKVLSIIPALVMVLALAVALSVSASATTAAGIPTYVEIGGIILYSTDTDYIGTGAYEADEETAALMASSVTFSDGVYTLDCAAAFPTGSDVTGTGTAVYDSSTGTLTLNEVTVPFTYHVEDPDSDFSNGDTGDSLFVYGGATTLILNGDNVFGIAGTDNTVSDFYFCDGSVTVTDGSESGNSSLTIYGYDSMDYCYGLNASYDIAFQDVDYRFIGCGSGYWTYGLGAWSCFHMDGGSVDINVSGDQYGIDGLSVSDGMEISDAAIDISVSSNYNGDNNYYEVYGIYTYGGDMTFSGCDFDVSAAADVCTAYGIYNDNENMSVTDGDFNISAEAESSDAYGIYLEAGDVTISGGTVIAQANGGTAINSYSVTYDGLNTILYDTNPGILDASTSDGAVTDLSLVEFSTDYNSYIIGESVISYLKIGTASSETESSPPIIVYNVTAEPGEGGTITPKSKTVIANTSVNFTITPDDGYSIASLSVNGEAAELDDLTDNGDGTYGYLLKITRKTTVEVTFASDGSGAEEETYTDIDEWGWASDSIEFVIDNGYMGSNSEYELVFDPWDDVSCGIAVAILYRMAGSPELTEDDIAAYEDTFSDTASGASYYDAVVWATANGITRDMNDCSVLWASSATREQLVAFMYRFADYMGCDMSGTSDLSGYTDADDISDRAEDAFAWAVGSGVIDGTSNTTLSPTGGANRAQFATIIRNFITVFGA